MLELAAEKRRRRPEVVFPLTFCYDIAYKCYNPISVTGELIDAPRHGVLFLLMFPIAGDAAAPLPPEAAQATIERRCPDCRGPHNTLDGRRLSICPVPAERRRPGLSSSYTHQIYFRQ